jgi:hypothetical protein
MGTKRGAGPPEGSPQLGQEHNSLLSSIGKERGMGASLVVEGSTNGMVFQTYLEDVLLPTLERGQIVVLDNLSAHKGERVRELIEGKGCELLSTCHPSFA